MEEVAANSDTNHEIVEIDEGLSPLSEIESQIEKLLDAGEEIGGNGNFSEAREKFNEALQLATEYGFPLYACKALDRIASADWEKGDYVMAESALRRVEALAEVVASEYFHAYTQYRLAWILAETQNYSDPSDVFALLKSARAGLKAADNPTLVAECDEKMAMVYANLKNYSRAAEFYDRAANVFEALGRHDRAMLARANEAFAIGETGDRESKISLLQEVIEEAESRNALGSVKGAGVLLADELLEFGDVSGAEKVLNSVDRYFVRYPNVYESARYFVVRSKLHLAKKEYELAHQNILRVFELADQLSHSHRLTILGKGFEVLGKLRLMEKKEDEADVAFAQAVLNFVKDDDMERAFKVAQQIRPDSHKVKPRQVSFGFSASNTKSISTDAD